MSYYYLPPNLQYIRIVETLLPIVNLRVLIQCWRLCLENVGDWFEEPSP